MSQQTAIEWTEATLNPWTGCTKVSPGCAHCYIPRTMPFRTAHRDFVGGHIPLVFHMDRLERMTRRRKPTLYFVNSLSDLFHEDAHDEQIARVFAAMADAPQHTFQVLTKRPERAKKLLGGAWIQNYVDDHFGGIFIPPWPLPNVWLGVTVENRRLVHRADLLRDTPAAVRFISAEPLLGPLVRPGDGVGCTCGWPLDGCAPKFAHGRCGRREFEEPELDLTGIDWLIAGGESGKGHRRLDLQWVRDLRDACAASGTAFFVKQLGGHRPGNAMDDLPEDLRIREMPYRGVTA